MGILSALGKALTLPSSIIKDVVTGGDDLVNGGDTATEKKIKKILEELKDDD